MIRPQTSLSAIHMRAGSTPPPADGRSLTRRDFCILSAVALVSLVLPSHALADEWLAPSAQGDAIVIVHTNDVHCSIEGNLGYAKLVDYVKDAKATHGVGNVTLVDAGDAVQGNAMGTLTGGKYLVDIMNECAYDLAVPGNHEFDYGMAQFNTLVSLANARYLSCNFTDLRTSSLILEPYTIKDYQMEGGTKKVAFLGICTPESLTASSPSHFWDDNGNTIYGFCEDESGTALYAAVQSAVDRARADGADFVIAIAHLGQAGSVERWRSTTVVANTTGIDVLIDGHSHEERVETVSDKAGNPVIITQTGTKLTSIGQVVIDPSTGLVQASTPHCSVSLVKAWDGSDRGVALLIADLKAQIASVLDQVIGRCDARLVAFEDDDITWAVRARQTNLGDLVSDAYLALAKRGGIRADIAFINGGGLRADVESGDLTYGDILNVQPFSNQICCVEASGQSILDALEMGARLLPERSGSLQHVAGLTYTVWTDVPSSVQLENEQFVCVTGEYRVRDVRVSGRPLELNKRYRLVSTHYMLAEGGDGMTMFMGDKVVLLDLDSAALTDYVQKDLQGVIGTEYANPDGQGRLVIKNGPDPKPSPAPNDETTSGNTRLPKTGDQATVLGAAAVGAAVIGLATIEMATIDC